MNSWLIDVIERHRNRGLIVDTNILLVRCVGDYRPDLIARFKRTRAYTAEDYARLVRIWSRFKQIWTTPSILAEISNLIGPSGDKDGAGVVSSLLKTIGLLEESYTAGKTLAESPHFGRLGLTDVAISHLASTKLPVLTDDLRLYHFLVSNGIDAINFNHLRFRS